MFVMRQKDKVLFSDYGEYYHHTRPLSLYQKVKIFKNFPSEMRILLENSYIEDGWSELVETNIFEQKISYIKSQFNKDLYQIKIKIDNGFKIKVKESFWKFVQKELSDVSDSRKLCVLGGIVCHHDPLNARWLILKKG